jgi:imidazolonepropionase
MLPRAAARNAELFVDVFCDRGGFDLQQSLRILDAAASLGLRTKVHSDEFANLGCTAAAAALGVTSADHLVATTTAEMDAMAAAGTVAVLLPGTTVGLGSTTFAQAREMIARGVPVAVGTDLNPGTSPCPSLPLMVALAVRYLRLTPAEALVAVTANAAASCGEGDGAGRIIPGGRADLLVLEARDYRDLAYWYGVDLVLGVMCRGKWVVEPLPIER